MGDFTQKKYYRRNGAKLFSSELDVGLIGVGAMVSHGCFAVGGLLYRKCIYWTERKASNGVRHLKKYIIVLLTLYIYLNERS